MISFVANLDRDSALAMEAASTLVIKVKYGDVLRRFRVRVVDEELDLSMNGLREKISSLFSFSPETEMILTYIDEDGDVVTLVDYGDLVDAMKQALNPLRISVELKSEKYGLQVSPSSGNSTPLISPRAQKSDPVPTSDLYEILETLQEPMCETLVKHVADVASNSATPVEGFTELIEHLSNVSLSKSDQHSRIPVGGMPSVPPHPASRDFLFMGSNQYEGRKVITHQGVRCDCCGVRPIIGPRFNSKVKDDFDLCEICFNKMGMNYIDYVRLDYPTPYHTLKSLKNVLNNASHYYPDPNIPQAGRGPMLNIGDSNSKLSSCFIKDVNVVDGTFMAPLTPFTKIWRMGNNGTVIWPKKTQLIWVGGDKLCNGFSFELDIPEAGIAVDKEIDVSVDFISPEGPGQYISYWRMASPSGQMFGQHIWVLIQVDASLKEIRNTVRNFDLNSLPTCNDASGHEIVEEDLEPMVEDTLPQLDNSNNTVQSVQPVIESQPNVEHEKKFPINNSLLVGSGASSSVSSPNPSSVPYPNINFSNVWPVFSSVPRPTSVVRQLLSWFPKSPAQEIPKEVESEEKLLKKLKKMGFKKVELNKEVLWLNEYNLVETVDDLRSVEWNPMLEELMEMGFTNINMNKVLLKKNNGSIEGVVMDFIAEENS